MKVCYLRDGDRGFETYRTTARGCDAMGNSYRMLDMTVYGRQEPWELSRGLAAAVRNGQLMSQQFRLDGRPISQWSRLAAGRFDDLGSTAVASDT